MIENRLIELSKNKNIFSNNTCTYQNALDKSKFKHKLTYKDNFKKQKKKRQTKCNNLFQSTILRMREDKCRKNIL